MVFDARDRQVVAKCLVVSVLFTVSVLLVACVLGVALRLFLFLAFA
jgi:hypothetical protein